MMKKRIKNNIFHGHIYFSRRKQKQKATHFHVLIFKNMRNNIYGSLKNIFHKKHIFIFLII